MQYFFICLPLLALSAGCGWKIDRDLRIFAAHNACSGSELMHDSKVGLKAGMDQFDEIVQSSGRSIRMSIINLTKRSIDQCANGYEADKSSNYAMSKLSQWRVQYLSYSSGELEALLWWAHYHLDTAMATRERRIFFVLTGEGTMYGRKELGLQEFFVSMCPLVNTPTAKQVEITVLPKGVGVYIWLMSTSESAKDQDRAHWVHAMKQARITDYAITAYAQSTVLPLAHTIFLEQMCMLSAPSYLATTTTYKPFSSYCDTSDCLSKVGREDGYEESVANPDRFTAKFKDCLLHQ